MSRLLTEMQVLVSAIKYNYQVNLLTPTQFKRFWQKIPNVLTQRECIMSLKHAGLIKLAENITKFTKLLQIIQNILNEEKNNDSTSNEEKNNVILQPSKLDELPMVIIQNISSFLTYTEFLCNLSLTNRFIFIAIQSPSHLKQLDYRHLKVYLSLTAFQETLSNHPNIHWLGIPDYILNNIDIINEYHNRQLTVTHLAVTTSNSETSPNYNAQNMLKNMLNTHLFTVSNLIFLDLTVENKSNYLVLKNLNQEINQLLAQCVNLQHLKMQMFESQDLTINHTKINQLLPKLKYLSIGPWSGLCGIRIIQSIDHQLQELNLSNPNFGEQIISEIQDKLNLIDLKKLHLHLVSSLEIYWILSICAANLCTVEMSNFHRDYGDKQCGTIQNIVRNIISQCHKLEHFKISNIECLNELEEQNCHYMYVYDGIFEGIAMLEDESCDSLLEIQVEDEMCIEQILEIFEESKRNNKVLKIIFEGTTVYDTKEDWENKVCLSRQNIEYQISNLKDIKIDVVNTPQQTNKFKFIIT